MWKIEKRLDEANNLWHTSGLRLKKYEVSAQMEVARVVRASDSGPKTDSVLVFARGLASAAPGASWEY
jgi:hypothetical protein